MGQISKGISDVSEFVENIKERRKHNAGAILGLVYGDTSRIKLPSDMKKILDGLK